MEANSPSGVTMVITGTPDGLQATPYSLGSLSSFDIADGAGVWHHFLGSYESVASVPKVLEYRRGSGSWGKVASPGAAFVYGMFGVQPEIVGGVPTLTADFEIRVTPQSPPTLVHGYLTGLNFTMPNYGGGSGTGGTDANAIHVGDTLKVVRA